MSQQLNKNKTRLRTVNGVYKVTAAMKLVSSVKLKKYKGKMLSNKDYNQELNEITSLVLSSAKKNQSDYSRINEGATKKLYVIISSTLGLCGAYNNNIFNVASVPIKEEDDAIILGKKALLYFKNATFNHVDLFSDYKDVSNEKLINSITDYISKSYLDKVYSEVHIIYTEYKNSLVFIPKDYKLLPLNVTPIEEFKEEVILEPSEKELVNTLIPFFIKGDIYAKLLESEVCEQASRANAMEAATDNAKELIDDLKVQFNKARQQSITQEITEIVSAANAI